MKTEGEADDLIDQSEADLQQHILERLWHRNWVRKQIGLPPINIQALYWKKAASNPKNPTQLVPLGKETFLDEKPDDQHDPLALSPTEVAEIIEDIRHSNEVRRRAQMPLIDENQAFARQAQLRIDAKYRAELEPYLPDAFQQVEVKVGLAGRMLMTLQAWHLAEAALLAEKGIAKPNRQSPDIVKSIIRYSYGSLAARGVS